MEIEHFHIVGINYKKTDASIRGQYALNNDQYARLLQKAQILGLNNIFILSTCNRTEIYGISPSEQDLQNLLCSETVGDLETFISLAYYKRGQEAITHLFQVAAGLDSQILGDYEIVGQLKQAIKFAKANGSIGTFIERLSNTVFQSSKAIKNQTDISGGTISVAFSAIQFLRIHCSLLAQKKMVVIGSGKIGQNTCKNLVDYLKAKDITLINRSIEKAQAVAGDLGLKVAPYAQYKQQINEADIIIVATNAPEPIVFAQDISHQGEKIFIDLSIPNNVDPALKDRPETILVNVDDLSKLNDITLQMRQREIPKVKNIIDEHLQEFYDWHQMRRNVPFIRAAKQSMIGIHHCPWFQQQRAEAATSTAQQEDSINKAIKKLAVKMRQPQKTPGCACIETLHEFVTHDPETLV